MVVRVREKYSPDQKDWDESKHPRGGNPKNPGQFSAAAGTGETPDMFGGVPQTAAAVAHAIDRTLVNPGTPTWVTENNRQTMEAALATHAVLAEMQFRGYKMPDSVAIVARPDLEPMGATSTFTAGGEARSALQIIVPSTLPQEASLDSVVKSVFQDPKEGPNAFTVENTRDIVIHEMGHVQSGMRAVVDQYDGFASNGNDYSLAVEAAFTVSKYAGKNANEFLAESFVRLYRGEKLKPEAQALYDRLNGPKIL